MGDDMITEGMLDMFIFETEQGLENLENICLESKDIGEFDEDNVNEIFRIMHTIKGSSAVMMFQNVATLAHKLEDVFYFIRESHPDDVPHDELVDDVLEVSDFITEELEKIKDGADPDEDPAALIEKLDKFLKKIQNKSDKDAEQVIAEKQEKAKESEKPHFYIAPVASDDSKFYNIYITYYKETEMANIRAYMAVNSLKGIAEDILYTPSDIISNPDSADVVLEFGFRIALQTTEGPQTITELINSSAGIENIEIKECTSDEFLDFCVEAESKPASSAGDVLTAPVEKPTILVDSQKPGGSREEKEEADKQTKEKENETDKAEQKAKPKKKPKRAPVKKGEAQSFISVNIKKMDLLMDLIGELVIAEAVVLQNPDLKVPGLDLTNFQKSAGQLSKITSELQDAIMAMRMMPLKNTFQKMNRIVYDTSKKLGKDIELEVIGEDTEVDKNIIEHISDPLMHLIRNSVDHGIESDEDRKAIGKTEKGKVVLEAKNEGGEKAKANGLLGNRTEKDLTEKEIFNFITVPGFSTKKKVTEYSGRGVGMDVVVKNIQQVGGVLDIESVEGQGFTMTMKIPLTLAIIDGIIFSVGETNFVTPTNSVTELIRIEKDKLIVEPDGEEYVMIREECYPLIRLNRFYHLDNAVEEIDEGIVIILNHEDRKLAVFADRLAGEQEIVVKPIPSYVKKVKGISGCTQLGDGSISLILDTGGLVMN